MLFSNVYHLSQFDILTHTFVKNEHINMPIIPYLCINCNSMKPKILKRIKIVLAEKSRVNKQLAEQLNENLVWYSNELQIKLNNIEALIQTAKMLEARGNNLLKIE